MSVTEGRVLAIVRELVAELGGSARTSPTLDALLDRDLGLSSLERVELLLRLERAFGVSLGDVVLAGATTPRDLVAAVEGAAPAGRERAAEPDVDRVPAAGIPDSAATLVEALTWHADRTPDRVHVHLRGDDGHEHRLTYGRLHADAAAVAAGLRARGVAPREPVILMLRTEADFFSAFAGTLMASAIPVPIYPPVRPDQLADYARRQRAIVESAGARVLITTTEAERLAPLILGQAPMLETIATVDMLSAHSGGRGGVAVGTPEAPALIQYTSGSTGMPKGVLLTHANLLANVRAIGQGLTVRPDDVCVSWLPLYHDMGLIGAWLAPLYYGVPLVVMSPLAFLARPSRWLWAIHAHRGTVSPAPNFAFDLAARKATDDELQGLDLSSWRLALNGSEMVSPETIARFTDRFAPYGFRPEAMCPVYGLAEASVGLTMTPIGRLPRVDRVDREAFERRRELRPAADGDPHPLRFVSCGRPLPGLEVRVVDAAGDRAPDREEGRIEFRGASVTQGYYGNPEATAAARSGDWMASGDLGYWADGDLFITGRVKDIIIQGGRNVSASEVESVVSEVPGVRRGCVAAFGVYDQSLGTERLVIVAETRERDESRHEALRQAVVERLVLDLGVPPDAVVLAPPGAVLKTSSGKVRRDATRQAYAAGSLGQRTSRMRQAVVLLADAAAHRAKRGWQSLRDLLFTIRIGAAVATTVPFLWVGLRAAHPGTPAIRVTRRWARTVLRLSGVRVAVEGLEHLRTITGALVVANHASYVDPIVLMAALPVDVHFAAKRGLTRYPLIGLAITRSNHLTIERGELARRLEGAEDLIARLRDDTFIAVFPEGTFERRRGLLPFRLGAFKAAVETGRPVVPVALEGTRRFWGDGARLFHHARLSVTIGAPLSPHGDGLPEIVRLRDEARALIARHAGEPLT